MSADNFPPWIEPEELPEDRYAAQESLMEFLEDIARDSAQEKAALAWAIETGAKP